MSKKRSLVHSNSKTLYRVRNWGLYDRALVRRGDLTLWFDEAAISAWELGPHGTRGRLRPGYLRPASPTRRLYRNIAFSARACLWAPDSLRQGEGAGSIMGRWSAGLLGYAVSPRCRLRADFRHGRS